MDPTDIVIGGGRRDNNSPPPVSVEISSPAHSDYEDNFRVSRVDSFSRDDSVDRNYTLRYRIILESNFYTNPIGLIIEINTTQIGGEPIRSLQKFNILVGHILAAYP